LAALRQLDGAERDRAEDLLIRFLPDARAIIGLGVLRSQRARPTLALMFEAERLKQREALAGGSDDWYPFSLMYLAAALWQIRPDPQWPAAVIVVLTTAVDDVQRESAAEALYDVRDTAAAAALVKALDDHDSVVRYQSARGLLAIYGLPTEPKNIDDMMYRVMSKDADRRDGGKRDILAAIAGRTMAAP
jgi:hypothetical protein